MMGQSKHDVRYVETIGDENTLLQVYKIFSATWKLYHLLV